ncbi:Hypothetical protein NTJ_02028 [Nesidiocoris tenuis]|nr:Hypothetical protein NTJ_02028 [Nesidiocoris tenuis]
MGFSFQLYQWETPLGGTGCPFILQEPPSSSFGTTQKGGTKGRPSPDEGGGGGTTGENSMKGLKRKKEKR